MKFIESYKRLDNLLKDCFNSETGVTSYIKCLEKINSNKNDFNDDYKKLKYYRHIRNRIVHDNDASEEKLISKYDVLWIEKFYTRVIKRSDPYSIYCSRRRKTKSTNKNRGNKKSKFLFDLKMFFAIFIPVFIFFLFILLFNR